MKLARWFIILAGLLAGSPVVAQPEVKSLPETKVVLRISRSFIRELTGVEFTRDEPIATTSAGAFITGNANVDGKFDVRLHPSKTESNFDLLIHGTIQTQLTATRRPVHVYAHGLAPFDGRCRVVFDGVKFSRETVCVNVTNRFCFDGIDSFRGGPIGALTRGIARPIARRNVADGQADAGRQMADQIAQPFGEAGDKLVSTLNRLKPIIKKGADHLQEEGVLGKGDLVHYLAASEENLSISIGLKEHQLARLPELAESKRAPLELWITAKNPKLELYIKEWELVKPFVLARIKTKVPDLDKVVARVHIENVPGWHVITFAPDLPRRAPLQLP